ncbi:DEAD/DEAH box helicase [Haloferax sp. DFSO52]|uniref:DEAD/DEAH box helicase n=1 Tax=Haloferax sp. DFSO52 TaxID=3388505 RepID=UPI003A85ABE2
MQTKPEGIEALHEILQTLESTSSAMQKGEIETHLSENAGYVFNNEGIRGYPDILQLLGVIQKEGHSYRLADPRVVKRYKRRFRKADIFRILESRLNREGSTVTPPSDTAKRDLMKYYMYREAGGWSKRRQWYRTFWRDYLQPVTRKGETGSELRKKESYRKARNRKRDLRDTILDKYDDFESEDLRGLSAGVLERMSAASSEEEAHRIRISAGSGISRADLELLSDTTREAYTFPKGFSLYDWQAEAAMQWFEGGDKRAPNEGIAQVVTGAGKTVMALEVIRQWLHADADRVVTVLVPTNVLMRQWLTELVSTLNIPLSDIGWAGGGHKDDFDDCRVIVSIINSAVKNDFLKQALTSGDVGDHLLIADECHRYTGETFSNVFEYPRAASLGLSATPISQATDGLTESDKLLLGELGDIYYELTYDEAITRGLIPEFTIEYVGFDLAPQEQREYDALSRKVSDAIKDIRQRHDYRLTELSGSFAQKLNAIRNSTEGPTPEISDYFRYTQERRELVDNAVARQAITLDIMRDAIRADQKTIVFQERIDQLNKLIAPHETLGRISRTGEAGKTAEGTRQELYSRYEGLEQADEEIEKFFAETDVWPVMYHSGHSRQVWNEFSMDWFREDNMANVMFSVKALIEGVDVPSADVGIVRVSSSSIRQRIQTLGRILRTGENAAESTLYVLYARDTVDERIFHEYDWKEELASARVEHSIWDFESEETYHTGQRRPATEEEKPDRPEPPEIPDPDELELGDPYQGPRDPIRQVSVDSRGQLFEKTRTGRRYIKAPQFEDIVSFVFRKKGGGTILINEHNHVITMLKDGPVFLGTVDNPEVFEPLDNESEEDGNTEQSKTRSSTKQSLTDDPGNFDDIFR